MTTGRFGMLVLTFDFSGVISKFSSWWHSLLSFEKNNPTIEVFRQKYEELNDCPVCFANFSIKIRHATKPDLYSHNGNVHKVYIESRSPSCLDNPAPDLGNWRVAVCTNPKCKKHFLFELVRFTE